VVNYLKACPLPEAAVAITKLEQIDPEAVRRAATLAGFAGALAPQPGGKDAAASADDADGDAGEPPGGRSPAVDTAAAPSADDAALAARIAPVIADEDATDDETATVAAADATLPAASPAALDRWKAIKWAAWTVIVLAIAVFSRSALTSRPPPGPRSASGSTTAPK
jgi:hypothetical protein